MTTETKRRPDAVMMIAVYHFIEAALIVLGMLALAGVAFLILFTATNDPGIVIPIFFLTLGGIMLGLFAAANVVVGWGLLNLKNWARWAAIVLSILRLPNFPLGTVIGGLSLYYLVQDEAKEVFETA